MRDNNEQLNALEAGYNCFREETDSIINPIDARDTADRLQAAHDLLYSVDAEAINDQALQGLFDLKYIIEALHESAGTYYASGGLEIR